MTCLPGQLAPPAKSRYNGDVRETETPPAPAAATPCHWMFHGVTRRDNGDGTVTLTLDGSRYTSNAERDPGDTSTCLWCHQPVTRTNGQWSSAAGDWCPEAGPDGLHYIAQMPAAVHAAEPCATVTVPLVTEVHDGETWVLYECGAAYDLARAHCGEHYTVVWQGRGWTVEISSSYPLWQVTS